MGKILAIDYGLKRVGLAVTDDLQLIASGLCTVEEKEVLAFLQSYLKKNEVEAFVLGDPKDLQGRATHSTEPVKKFAEALRKTFPDMPLHWIDERFTSKMAMEALVAGGAKKKTRQKKELIDEISATIILQSYLETR